MGDLIDRDELLAEIQRDIETSGCVNHERDIMDSIRYATAVHICATPAEIAALRDELEAVRADIEAGRLVRYPCRVGDAVWIISRAEPEMSVESERVEGIIDTGNGPIACRDYDFDGLGAIGGCWDSPKPYYLTRKEAEAARAALEGGTHD